MKKLLIFLILLLTVAGAGIYFGGGYLLDTAAAGVLPDIKKGVESAGAKLPQLDLGKGRFTSYNAVTWYGLRARVVPPLDATLSRPPTFDVTVDSLTLRVLDLGFTKYALSIEGAEIRPASKIEGGLAESHGNLRKGMSEGYIDVQRFETIVEVDPRNPMPGIARLIDNGKRFLKIGELADPFSLQGILFFTVKNRPYEVAIRADNDGRKIVLDPDQLAKAAPFFSSRLNEKEIAVVAENPLRAARLLTVKEYAEVTSHQAAAQDATVPEDAYRCVLWSYLLTKEHGAKLAERITSAHEEGDEAGSIQSRQMDLNNYAVGRRYAAERIPESEVLARLQRDPAVIKKEV